MKFKHIISVCILVAILAVGAVSASDANSTDDAIAQEEISVDELSVSEGDVLKADDGTFTTLKSKIDSAEAGSTLNLVNDYRYDEGFDTKGIHISKDLTINGNGHTLDAQSKSRIFEIGPGVSVVLNNIRFTNAFANYGSAIKSEADLEINKCVFETNKAEHDGWISGDSYWSKYPNAVASGTVLSDGNLKVKSSTFTNNEAEYYGGAIDNFRGNLIVENSRFTANKADGGGAIYNWRGTFRISNSEFRSNAGPHTGSEGGAILATGGGISQIDNTLFYDNFASRYGGAISVSIWNSERPTLNVNYCEFDKNAVSDDGGAIYIANAVVNMDHVTFKENIAGVFSLSEQSNTPEGGAIYNGYSGELKVTNSKFIKNSPNARSNGAVYTDESFGTATSKITGCVFSDYYISASNLKTVYRKGSYYSIRVYDSDKNLKNGVKVVVKINNRAFKTLRTDSKGIVKFKVSQAPGTYKVKITALGETATKKLTVKHLLSLKKVTVKKSLKKLVLKATLSKLNGKYLKGKKVTFKFNGKKYSARTDKKGVAKVTVKKSVLNKLKVGKKIIYQATYLKDTVKVAAKVKR